jgi:hypothetical protein
VTLLGDERQRRRDLVREEGPHLRGGRRDVVAVELEDLPGGGELVEDDADEDVLHGEQLELEGGDDAEVPAAPAEGPEEVRVLRRARDTEAPVGEDHVRREQVVDRQAVPAREVADAAAERPPTPVVEMIPPVVAPPNGYVAWKTSPQVAPPSARTVRARGATRTPLIRERSTTTPPSFVPKPGTLCEPPRTERSSPLSRAKPTAAITSAALVGRATTRGRRSIIAL